MEIAYHNEGRQRGSLITAELRELITLARERRRARCTRLGPWEYLRFVGKVRRIPEGTAVFGDTMVWGFPKIGRILQLEPGIQGQFEQPFWVEEKIDGYNVRIFRQGDDVLALTRRGYICPFTSDRLVDFIDTRIFDQHPELVLCAEAAGPDNPYTAGSPGFIDSDIRLYVFDIMRKNESGCLPYAEKLQLLETYGLPSVARFGRYQIHEWYRLKPLLLELDRDGREGIVLKEDSERGRRIKYVTGRSNVSDIGVGSASLQQLPPEYFMHRVMRFALFLEEHGLEATPELHRELGESLMTGLLDTITGFRNEGKIYHGFRCRFHQRANAELMMRDMIRRLGKGLVRRRRLVQEGEFYVLEFDKVMPRFTDLLRHQLGGGVIFD